MNTTFYAGLGISFLFLIGVALWLARDYYKEKKKYPFKHKKEK